MMIDLMFLAAAVLMAVWLWWRGVIACWVASYAAGLIEDDVIDPLIETNRARPIPGMERCDRDIMERVGHERWRQVVGDRTRETVAVLRGPRT